MNLNVTLERCYGFILLFDPVLVRIEVVLLESRYMF